jgi:hypothetical protein
MNSSINNSPLTALSIPHSQFVQLPFKTVLGLTATALGLLLVAFILWIVAIVFLAKEWDNLKSWAKVIGMVGVSGSVPFGSIITLIVIAAGKKDK